MKKLVVLDYSNGMLDIINVSEESSNRCDLLGDSNWLVYDKLGYKESETEYMIVDDQLVINQYEENEITN